MNNITLRTKLSDRSEQAPLFEWDAYKVWKAEVDYLMNEKGMSEEDAQDQASHHDWDLEEREWRWLCECVEEWMADNDFYHFYMEVGNVGWRKLHGNTTFAVDTGAQFLRKVAAMDQYDRITLYESGKPGDDNYYLYGTVSEHDGTGSRQVYPVPGCWICGEPIAPGDEGSFDGGVCHKDCAYAEFDALIQKEQYYEFDELLAAAIEACPDHTYSSYQDLTRALFEYGYDWTDDLYEFAEEHRLFPQAVIDAARAAMKELEAKWRA